MGFSPVGCMTTRDSTLPDRRPSDFTLGVVVMGTDESDPTSRKPARYIIEPDGSFRASVGSGSSTSTYPPFTRRLEPDQLDQVWDLVRAIDLDNAMNDAPAKLGYIIEIRSSRTQREWSFSIEPGSTMDLVEHLADLAWIAD